MAMKEVRWKQMAIMCGSQVWRYGVVHLLVFAHPGYIHLIEVPR